MKTFTQSLLATAAAITTITVAQAADLPSRKAAPASYVKICDAYGAGFFYIPGTDTCVKLGGYVRAEYQYTPGQKVYTYSAANSVAAFATPTQIAGAQDTTGMEMRGRIDVDARTATPWGSARTYIRLRLVNTSGIRNSATANNGNVSIVSGATTSPTIESALVQWAGFTFGVAPENYAFMPTFPYHGTAYTQFTTGAKQMAYTATFGGGLSATVALEDRSDWGYSTSYANRLDTGVNIVGNVKWDQSWGFAVLHGAIGNNSISQLYPTGFGVATAPAALSGNGSAYSNLAGAQTYGAYAIGGTVMFNLPMFGPGDKLWLTANYTKGMLGALLPAGGLSVVNSGPNRRLLGGITRIDQNLVVTGGAGTAASPYTIGSTTGWNVAMAGVHYWAPQWRSQVSAGYVQINPATSTFTQWGSGRLWTFTNALIFSPAKDFDFGFEVAYANLRNNIQNPAANFLLAGSPGLSESNWSTKLRVERAF
jgi:hypothetical protein